MDTLTPSTVATDRSHSPGLRRTEVALLVGAPVVLAVGRLTLIPYDDQKWDHMLGQMAAHHSRNAFGWGLALVAAALLVASGLALVRLVPGRPGLTVPALVGVALGWVGTAGVATGGLVMGDMADSPDRRAMVDVLTNFNEGNGNVIFVLIVAGVLGNVLLASALRRSGIASRGTVVVISVGAVLSLTGAPGPAIAIAVSGAVLMLVGHLLLLRGMAQAPSGS